MKDKLNKYTKRIFNILFFVQVTHMNEKKMQNFNFETLMLL